MNIGSLMCILIICIIIRNIMKLSALTVEDPWGVILGHILSDSSLTHKLYNTLADGYIKIRVSTHLKTILQPNI